MYKRARIAGGFLFLVSLLCGLLGGCGAVRVAFDESGRAFPCVPIAAISGSPEQIGNAVGGVLGAVGVPGAIAIGTGITSLLGALGWGAKRHGDAKAAEARREGERFGWDEGVAESRFTTSGRYAGPARGVDVVPGPEAAEGARA